MRINIQLFGGRGASSSNNKTSNRIKDIIDNGKVIEFGRGPSNTYIALKENGYKSSTTWDAPIKLATRDGILNKINNEAVAIADTEQVKLRSDYFKRNGFEVVGTQKKSDWETYILIKRK